MVDGLLDSIDMEPRVRLVVLFGVSSAASLAAIFFSSSRCANDLTCDEVLIAGAAIDGVAVIECDGLADDAAAFAFEPAGVVDNDLDDDVDDCEEGRD